MSNSTSSSKTKEDGETKNDVIDVEDSDDDDEDPIDDEQLEDYREMIEQLGSFPVRVRIQSINDRFPSLLPCIILKRSFNLNVAF